MFSNIYRVRWKKKLFLVQLQMTIYNYSQILILRTYHFWKDISHGTPIGIKLWHAAHINLKYIPWMNVQSRLRCETYITRSEFGTSYGLTNNNL